MKSEKYANAYVEVLYYLKGIDKNYVNKIPQKLIIFFEQNANSDYRCDFDYYLPLKDLNLSEEALGLIGMICLNYWCTTEEEKEKMKRKFYKNEQIYQEKLKEKYNTDVFKKKKNDTDMPKNKDIEEVSIIKYEKKNIIQKIFYKIKQILVKK